MRLVPAAQQLVEQVTKSREGQKVGVTWLEPDGLGRTRDITFDPATSKWLMPILMAVRDPRIRLVSSSPTKPKKAGQYNLTVTFVSDVRADSAHPFAIEEADEVLNGPAEPVD